MNDALKETTSASPALRAYLDLMASEVGMALPRRITEKDAEELRLLLQDLTGRGRVSPN